MITGNAQDVAAFMAMTNELSMLIGQLKGENEYLKRRVAELERAKAEHAGSGEAIRIAKSYNGVKNDN